MQQCDSLQSVADLNAEKVDRMVEYFDTIANCLDSISINEHLLLPIIDPETHRRYTYQEIQTRLELLKDLITRQRERILQLTDSLNNSSSAINISSTVLYLTHQLEEKENEVARLMAELNGKNRNISELNTRIGVLSSQLEGANELNENLSSALATQNEIINEGYILIGDKKALQNAGVLTKGNLIKKSQFRPEGVNLGSCRKVDISKVTEIPLSAKNPKILSPVPASSYGIVKGSAGSTLVIYNPTSFWSLSNVLVIQL